MPAFPVCHDGEHLAGYVVQDSINMLTDLAPLKHFSAIIVNCDYI